MTSPSDLLLNPETDSRDESAVGSTTLGQAEKHAILSSDQGVAKNDPFDPASLRLSQAFDAMLGGEKILNTIPVRKPSKEHWIRVHPDESYRLDTLVLELKEDSETYLLAAELQFLLGTEPTLRAVTLFTAVTRSGNVFLWPVPLPGPDGRDNEWYRSAREAALLGMQRWVRVTSSRSLGAYETTVTDAHLSEPCWTKLPLRDLLKIAFRDRYIDNLAHPVLRKLRGEI